MAGIYLERFKLPLTTCGRPGAFRTPQACAAPPLRGLPPASGGPVDADPAAAIPGFGGPPEAAPGAAPAWGLAARAGGACPAGRRESWPRPARPARRPRRGLATRHPQRLRRLGVIGDDAPRQPPGGFRTIPEGAPTIKEGAPQCTQVSKAPQCSPDFRIPTGGSKLRPRPAGARADSPNRTGLGPTSGFLGHFRLRGEVGSEGTPGARAGRARFPGD